MQGVHGSGGLTVGLTHLGFFQYGAEIAKLQRQLALEKEVQLQLQDEVRLPLGSSLVLGSPWP